MRVIDEGDAVQVDDPEVGCGLLQALNVDDLVDLADLKVVVSRLVGTDHMKDLDAIDEADNAIMMRPLM